MTTRQQKAGQASMRSEKVSAAQMAQYLKGIGFPASKQDVVNTARSNDAPEKIMSYMNRLPEKTYHRPTEVEQEFGHIK